MVSRGAELDFLINSLKKVTPVHLAADNNCTETIKYLANKGANSIFNLLMVQQLFIQQLKKVLTK
ncbi:hypothetical protein midi_00764 [Candidatus Midichloria mitochondrii IricVA]|uniref:Uncharacterized protein n=2 Tax=Candidatus Midichloria mitochondrii TaxID=234827 RepID=F7XWK5_MIDMI|nr:hypothetical protein midi_00764 [Candidatus Midichloria mitochondrii IricVA]